ncbi:D12 class N6 adenine-specific DNA methyltransferase [Leptospira phage vB_LbrZ_5399-LE1]|nr:D12 class N6 adenine-specific DNA methyltransferase [Leptospira phage vB_LbrZ_5399-LE1]AGS80851.1 D12 class N6 adenine-specific DNA methyltransferase [Leptospira phage vB_LinZ_10-LE1]
MEPFLGAGSILLSKERSWQEVGNDINGDIVNFFRVLRDFPLRLVRKIKYTPYSDRFLNEAFQNLRTERDPVIRAYYFYIVCWMNMAFNFISEKGVNFRRKGNLDGTGNHRPALQFRSLENLFKISERLRGVHFIQRDAEEVIRMYDAPGTLFYVDMPYLKDTRNSKILYNSEFNTKEDHIRILSLLTKIKGMAIISHYRNNIYDRILQGWKKEEKEAIANSTKKGKGKKKSKRTEVLYISPRARKAAFIPVGNKNPKIQKHNTN